MLENRPSLKLKNNATSFSGIFQSEQNWASYGVFVKTDDARTMLGCRTPFSFGLCISLKLSPALNLFLQHKLPINCSSLPKHSPPICMMRKLCVSGASILKQTTKRDSNFCVDQSQGLKSASTMMRKLCVQWCVSYVKSKTPNAPKVQGQGSGNSMTEPCSVKMKKWQGF